MRFGCVQPAPGKSVNAAGASPVGSEARNLRCVWGGQLDSGPLRSEKWAESPKAGVAQ